MALDINKIRASTIDAWSKDFADNFSNHNQLLAFIKDSGNEQTFDGGEEIREGIDYKANSNAASYDNADPWPSTAQDNQSAARFPWRMYVVTLPITGRQELTNTGAAQMLDLLDQELENAEVSLDNLINQHLYLDGTGNSGKNIIGLQAAVPLVPTNVYGGIDRDTLDGAFWKNKVLEVGGDTELPELSSSNVSQYFDSLMIKQTVGKKRPNLILVGENVRSVFHQSLTTIQRVTSQKAASLGFTGLEFQGVPVLFDSLVSGLDADIAYFLNTQFLKWRPHAKRNFIALDDKDQPTQDVNVKSIGFAGQLTCKGARYQGVFKTSETEE